MKLNLNQNFKSSSVIIILIIFTFYHILNGGIYSDYITIYSLKGIGHINGYENFSEYIIHFLHEQIFDRKVLRFSYIISILFGSFSSALTIKILHFLFSLLLVLQIFRFISLFFNKYFSFFVLSTFLICVQYSNYLDPLNAWPFFFFYFIILFEYLIIFINISRFKNVNKYYFFLISFCTLFFFELGILFYLNIIFFILLQKFFLYRDDNIKYLKISLSIFLSYIILKLYLVFSFSPNTYSGTSIGINIPESFISYFYQLIRSIPLTSLLINNEYYDFFKILKNNLYYPIFLFSVIFYYYLNNLLKVNVFSQKLIISKNYLFIFIALQLIFFPPILMSISERYSLQISQHGIGHAHYIVFIQSIGFSFILSFAINNFINKIKKKNIYIVFGILTLVFYINAVHHHYKTKTYYPERSLYPFTYFENLSEILKNKLNIDIVIIEDTEYKSWWDGDHNFSKFFGKEIKAFGHWIHTSNKFNNIKKYNLTDYGVIYFKNLKFNKSLFYGEYCYLKKGIEKSLNTIRGCKNTMKYEEKRFLGYIKLDSIHEKLKAE
jgi:hypothetical protein